MKEAFTIKASRYAQSLWNEWILQPDDWKYNLAFVSQIDGDLDILRLKNALLCFIDHNPVIRSSFLEENEILVQVMHPAIEEPVEYYDYRDKDDHENQELFQRLRRHRFCLNKAPLFRFSIVRTGEESFYLFLVFHHIIIDGTSALGVPEEISAYYNAGDVPRPDTVVYKDPQVEQYLEYEDTLFEEHVVSKDMTYWDELLSQRNFYTHLPRKEYSPGEPAFSPQTLPFALEEELTSRVKVCARKLGCTVFQLMAAVWAVFAYKYSNQDEITLLYPVSMRPKHLRDLKGYLVNPMPMLVDFGGESTLASTVWEIKEQRQRTRRRQYIPFDDIVDSYNKSAAVGYGQRSGNYLNVTVVEAADCFTTPVSLEGTVCTGIPSQTLSDSELHLIYKMGKTVIEGQICYNDHMLENAVFDGATERFKLLLERVLASPHVPVESISVLSAADYDQVVYAWNRTEAVYPSRQTIHGLFEEQAQKTPDNPALVFEGKCLTYRELNEKANQLAHTIRSEYRAFCGQEVQRDTLIGLYMDRGLDMITAILGILKSGAAYVPFDLADPEERLRFKINDCACKMIVTRSSALESLVFLAGSDTLPLSIDAYGAEIAKADSFNPACINTPDDLAAVIYTSGSTGQPKGVMTRHAGVVDFISYHQKNFPVSRRFYNVIQSISINFDASWTELALALFNGSTLHIIRSIARFSGEDLARFITENEIGIFISTPSMIGNLPRKNIPCLEYIISGGDVGDKSMMDAWSDHLKLYNAYGPTEATICTTYGLHDRNKSNRNIGRPLQNKTVYILDANLRPLPMGVPGELYIGGESLARGYFNRPELTEERFVPNPFVTDEEKTRGRNLRIYRTGDIARWLPDGNMEYIGRNDDQVKISGFRIELGEIENKLALHPDIAQCVVLCREHNGTKYLCAYFTADQRINPDTLNDHLAGLLPYYMVPQYFMQLEAMPLTVNDKIDRKGLPEPAFTGDADSYVPPRSDMEKALCGLWQEELGIEQVGIGDDFFRLGGSSIMAIRLCHRMTRLLEREIPVASLFDLKTIRALSEGLGRFKRLVSIDPAPGDATALSFAQERLFFIEEYEGGSTAYNIPMLYELADDVDTLALKKGIADLVHRQEVLRTVFVKSESGEVFQKVGSARPAILDVDLTGAHFQARVEQDIDSVFDLYHEYPIKTFLYHTEDKKYLLVTIHHIAFDGWSADIFLRELDALYRHHRDGIRLSLPKLEIQYRDFAVWERNHLTDDILQAERDYWENALAGHEMFDFPTDRPRPARVSYDGDSYTIRLDPKLSNALRNEVRSLGTTAYSLFLSGFFILLGKYSGQSDIIIGTPTANRQYVQLENLIGFFVNSTVLRCRLTPDLDIRGLIEHTAASLSDLQLHQDLPFEKLIELLHIEKDPSRHPLFQIMFSLQSFGGDAAAGALDFMTPVDTSGLYTSAKFDLTLLVDDAKDLISCEFNYATSLFEHETIARLADHYREILTIMVSGATTRIKDIPLLSPAERDKMLYDWNATEDLYPRDTTIVQMFEEQVQKMPDHTALVFEGEKWSYREINGRANQLAHTIRRDYAELTGQEITGDTLIGIYIERSVHMIVGILGILKAGAAYVPFDLADPEKRLRFKIHDCACRMMLTSSNCIGDLVFLTDQETQPVAIDAYLEEIEKSPDANPVHVNTSRDLAYVIYTSGSTGTPKGVMIEHYGVVNLALSHGKRFGMDEGFRILQFAATSFDASVSTLFCGLLNGGCLYLCDEEVRKDVHKLAGFIDDHEINLIDIPAKLLELMPRDREFSNLGHIITAGEVCDKETMDYWSDRVGLVNAYGPTEATVCTTMSVHTPSKSNLNIGKPISNKRVYVLDGSLGPVPVGVPGELYIGGDGLARGYLNRGKTTSACFVSNPFSSTDIPDHVEQRMYKTGDMVRWTADGELIFLGRSDDQVKINGYRIELAEIERKLSQLEGVTMCAVRVIDREQHTSLCAYYTRSKEPSFEGPTVTSETIRTYLGTVLPEYMIPALYVELESFPLNTSGKIDRNKLPDPDRKVVEDTYAPPRSTLEEELCGLWQEILGMDKIGINDDFFTIGGNSILAIKLSHRMGEILGREVAVADIFTNRTIARFALAGDQEPAEDEGEVIEL